MPAEQAKPSECQPVIAPFDVWRCSFTDVIAAGISSDWDLLVKGAGMTVSQTGGNALITTGTTANEEVIIRSKRTWEGAFAARWKAILSQRIANNTFVFEFADLIGDGLAYTINSATSVTVTVPNYPATVTPYFTAANVGQTVTLGNIRTAAGAILTTAPPQDGVIASVSGNAITFTVAGFPASGTGTLMLYGWNSYRGTYDGTTATNMKWETRRKGYSTALGTFTCSTTASPGHFVEARTTAVNAQIADTSGTVSTTSQFTTRAVRLENLPDPGVDMYMFIRAVNGTTNPATTTTLTIGFAGVEVVGRVDTQMIQTAQPIGTVGTVVTVVQGTGANLNAQVTGAAAQGSTASGNPVFTGGVAKTAIATARSDGQIVAPLFDKIGRQIVTTGQVRDLTTLNAMVTLTSTTETTIAAAVASIFNDLYELILCNTSATGVRVDFRTVAAGTVVASVWLPATTSLVIPLPVPLKQATVNTAWTAQLSAAVTDVRITAVTTQAN